MSDTEDIWKDDLLGFAARASAFTSLIRSINDHRTISIEAGYGHGKTFFRERWAEELEQAGECVVQIDARLSDHSGDPVVTFLGALLAMVPEQETEKREAVYSATKKILVAGGKAVAKAALREGFEEVADVLAPEDGGASTLHDIAKAAGKDLSKAAGDLIASQLSAEKARIELTAQLKSVHAQIVDGRETNRIIILIDELDRCHPDYAIALLEAMKLVFDQDGFVFVLMVNREYLEKVAAHRFGGVIKGESYLDKFVDLRLKLIAEDELIGTAAGTLTLEIPLNVPFGASDVFSVTYAAGLASELALKSGLSMRQIERLLERIEIACRLYKNREIDLSLLIWLGFRAVTEGDHQPNISSLPRAAITSKKGDKQLTQHEFLKNEYEETGNSTRLRKFIRDEGSWVLKNCSEIVDFQSSAFLRTNGDRELGAFLYVYMNLAPHYIPEHQAMLDAVHQLQADA